MLNETFCNEHRQHNNPLRNAHVRRIDHKTCTRFAERHDVHVFKTLHRSPGCTKRGMQRSFSLACNAAVISMLRCVSWHGIFLAAETIGIEAKALC